MSPTFTGPNRRQVLAGLAAVSFVRPAKASPFTLTAAPATAQLAPPEYAPTPVWAFNGATPGPLLRARQGERMRVRVTNGLEQDTAVHWHGLRLENAMDGVPYLTQAPISPGESFDYDFRLPDAGTYWYHSHNRSFEQVARGLLGPLIIDEAEPPEVDFDEVLVLDDWLFQADATLFETFGDIRAAAHGGRIGNWITVNGQGDFAKPLPRGARVRLRLINAANARVFSLRFRGMKVSLVALDGMPVPASVGGPLPNESVPDPDLTLAPAQRVDLIVDIDAEEGGEALILSRERDGDFALVSFPVDPGTAPRTTPHPHLRRNPVPEPTLAEVNATPRRELRMEGGAMRGFVTAIHKGEELDGRALAQRGMVWALNGIAGMPEEPFFEVPQGEIVRLVLINETRWPHGMHLHGHHFFVRGAVGPLGPLPSLLRDTVLLAPDERREIYFIADNPGDWLLHCHMLEHAHSGMMTWFRVT
ncbi:MAG: multicopper oxidase family protein [Paracoccaceae bacterium]